MNNVAVIMGRDWHAIEKLYVFGEVVRVREDGSEERTFPSIRAVAQRFGVSRSVVGERRSATIGWAAACSSKRPRRSI